MYDWASQGKLGPTLACETNDTFSVNRGNGDLTYPVGLITADEINMAGGVAALVNSLYYLYGASAFWTMSPSSFNSMFNPTVFFVNSAGILYEQYVDTVYGVRPVINLDPEKVTFTGSGTMQDPYVIA